MNSVTIFKYFFLNMDSVCLAACCSRLSMRPPSYSRLPCDVYSGGHHWSGCLWSGLRSAAGQGWSVGAYL